ncbi:MAG: hypothetical protein V3U36_03700, partial [Anaerolineales bacterium]
EGSTTMKSGGWFELGVRTQDMHLQVILESLLLGKSACLSSETRPHAIILNDQEIIITKFQF